MDDDEEDDNDSEPQKQDEEPEVPVSSAKSSGKAKATGQSSGKASKNAKKKQKKNMKKNAVETASDDDLDAILASVPTTNESEKVEENKYEKVLKEILKIEASNLDPAKEMARLFGTGVVGRGENGGNQDELDARMARRFGGGAAGRGRAGGVVAAKLKKKKSLIVKPKPSWPPVGPSGSDGLEMVLKETRQGVKYYKYEWSKEYKMAQKKFHEAVETGDPNALAALLRRFPYHIDTLLQLHDAFQMTEEKDAALELLERILYRFETSWSPSFDVLSSSSGGSSSSSSTHSSSSTPSSSHAPAASRLPYEYPENRSFHLAILAYLQEVGKKGCSATALEFSKLLLSLDLSDPLGILFLIDHFALRRREHLWLIRFYHSPLFEEHDLSILPNFVYSIALSCFYYKKSLAESASQDGNNTRSADGGGDDGSAGARTPSDASSLPHEFAHLNPEQLLHTAFEMHPSLFVHLAQRLATGLIRSKDGKNVLTDLPHFATAASSTPPMVNILHHLYIERNHALWKDPACITWLKQCASSFYTKLTTSSASAASETPSSSNVPSSSDTPASSDTSVSSDTSASSDITSRIASYQTLVGSLTLENPKRFHRHVMLSDFNAIIRMLPSEVLREGFHIYEAGEVGAPSSTDAPSQREGAAANASNLSRLLDYLVPFQADPQQIQNILNLIGYRMGDGNESAEEEEEEE